MEKEGIIIYDRKIKRFLISFNDGSYEELHCGDIFYCSPELNGWHRVRIEYDQQEWYLINTKREKISIWENMFAKK